MSPCFSQVLDQAQKNVVTATTKQKEANLLSVKITELKVEILNGYKKANSIDEMAAVAYLKEIEFFLEGLANGREENLKPQKESKETNLLKNTIKARLGFHSISRPRKIAIKNKILNELISSRQDSSEFDKASELLHRMLDYGMHEQNFWLLAKKILEIIDSTETNKTLVQTQV
jgi:hypothetical protein